MNKVGIIGGGSIGLLLAAYFCEADYEVTVYTKTKAQASELMRKGLLLEKELFVKTYNVNSIPFSDVVQSEDDFLFVAVKQYHVAEIIDQLIKNEQKLKQIVFLQNGMGHFQFLDMLKEKAENIFVGIVEHGAFQRSYTEVFHTGDGELKIGLFQQLVDMPYLFWESLTEVGFAAAIYENWQQVVEKKLIVNSVINPLTAIFNVKNGSLINNSYYFETMKKLFEEISLLFVCSEEDWQNVIKICDKTSENYSSMLKDILSGRPTEIDAITGVVLEKAREKGIILPYHQFVYQCVKGMEIEKGGRL